MNRWLMGGKAAVRRAMAVALSGLLWAQRDFRIKTVPATPAAVFRKFRREELAVWRVRFREFLGEDSRCFRDVLIMSPAYRCRIVQIFWFASSLTKALRSVKHRAVSSSSVPVLARWTCVLR